MHHSHNNIYNEHKTNVAFGPIMDRSVDKAQGFILFKNDPVGRWRYYAISRLKAQCAGNFYI